MRVLYVGTGDFGVPSLCALVESEEFHVVGVVTQPDRPVGRHQELKPSPIKAAAFKHHLKIYQPEDINSPTIRSQLKYLEPDIMVVCAYGQILGKPLLELPEKGSFNIHGSLLPKYRGAACIQAAIRNGDPKTGVTIIQMDEGLDTGDIVEQDEIPIKRNDTAEIVHDKLAALAPAVLLKALKQIARGRIILRKQDSAQASYVKKLTKEAGHIDWKQPQTAVDCHIRAMTPWPSAYSWVPDKNDQKMLKIFKTILSRRAKGKPGEVVRIDKHGILVAAQEGGLLLREVQLEGKKRMHAADFARGYNLAVGTILE